MKLVQSKSRPVMVFQEVSENERAFFATAVDEESAALIVEAVNALREAEHKEPKP